MYYFNLYLVGFGLINLLIKYELSRIVIPDVVAIAGSTANFNAFSEFIFSFGIVLGDNRFHNYSNINIAYRYPIIS